MAFHRRAWPRVFDLLLVAPVHPGPDLHGPTPRSFECQSTRLGPFFLGLPVGACCRLAVVGPAPAPASVPPSLFLSIFEAQHPELRRLVWGSPKVCGCRGFLSFRGSSVRLALVCHASAEWLTPQATNRVAGQQALHLSSFEFPLPPALGLILMLIPGSIYTLLYYSSFHFLFHYPCITPI